MKIIFSPFFSSNTFVLNNDQTILFSTAVCGETELLSYLELFLGLHTPKTEKLSREIEYYKACKKVIQTKGSSIFSSSFTTDELGTADNLLKWRDALSFCGWNKNMKCESKRLAILSEIDQLFELPGYGDRWQIVLRKLSDTNIANNLDEISITLPGEVLPPHLTQVFDLLEKQQIRIFYKSYKSELSGTSESNLDRIRKALLTDQTGKIQLKSDNDSSLRILEFETSMQACEWVATQNSKTWDVYINRENKTFDDVQYLLGAHSSGSQTRDSHTQIMQLFKLATGLFEYPVNINNLLGWLNANENPIPKSTRFSLARVIASEGGLGNQTWTGQINTLTQLTDEERKLSSSEQAGILQRKEYNRFCIDTFMPRISGKIEKDMIVNFFNELKKWCYKRIHTTDQTTSFEKEIRSAQFTELIAMIDALTELIENEETISYDKLAVWATKIYTPVSSPYTEAKKDSRFIINAPADIATSVDSCLWMDFYDYQNPGSGTNFLRTDEILELQKNGCYFWNSEKQNRYNYLAQIHPFICTKKQLTLISVEKNGLDNASRHPLYLRLKATLEEATFHQLLHKVSLDKDYTIQIPKENAKALPVYCEFKNTHYISMPQTTSYTALSELIQNPCDFVFERILKFNEASINVLNSLETTKGNVAHALIEYFLLRSRNGNTIDTSSFDPVYSDLLQKHGALLLQRENILQQMQFKHELYAAITTLINILHSNELRVTDCEQKFQNQLSDQPDSPVMIGYIDLKVCNPRNEYFIIDMKWTGFKSNQRRLKQNKALQLAIYEHFSHLNNENILGAGYFVMPVNRLYTTHTGFKGENISVITPDNENALIPQCINSYNYRVAEITESGKIEIAEGMNLSEIEYFNDTSRNNLYPLEPEYNAESLKKTNAYSAYKLFKNELL